MKMIIFSSKFGSEKLQVEFEIGMQNSEMQKSEVRSGTEKWTPVPSKGSWQFPPKKCNKSAAKIGEHFEFKKPEQMTRKK